MKEIIGLIAAAATVAGLAAAASGSSKKAKEEAARQEQLQLEQERLRMEREALAQQQQLAAQALAHQQALERQRMEEEAKQREYQRKLANAPRKAIYKPVSLTCPKCNGKREIQRQNAMAVCPYCDFEEPLEVVRYEIDQVAFQKQLQAEERQKQLAEAERQRKLREEEELRQIKAKRQNEVTACWLVVVGLVIFGLPISARLGLLSIYICFVLIGVVLIKTYPQTKPLLWGVIFPIPFGKLFLERDDIKEKFTDTARWLLIIGAWVVYIGALGGMFVHDMYRITESAATTSAEVAVMDMAEVNPEVTEPSNYCL